MSQPYGVSCKGGLNTNLNQLEMLSQPGLATRLINFEVDPDGGYRRINGFTLFGGANSVRPNTTEKILGMVVYADGVVVCSGTNIYFSQDGESWLQINKSAVHTSGDNYTTFTGRSVLTRTDQKECTFTIFEGTTDYGELLICDGANKPFSFIMTGKGLLETRTFFAKEITVNGSLAPRFGAMHEQHFVVAGADTDKDTIYYSHNFDPSSFGGTGAGSISLTDAVVGLASFRSDLIIFCENSIHKLVNISDPNNIAVIPVTKNVGCLDGQSIQEIGGDLVFLSPDGIRTVAGTARIGDVELGSVSRQIQNIIGRIASSIDEFTITSAVIRSRSQYRLFYTEGTENSLNAKGIIGTLTNTGFEWSETKGIQALGFASGFNSDGVEKIYHGDKDGYVYNHDTGDSFAPAGISSNISAIYQTPNYDFGDIGTRKTLKYVRMSFSPEGTVQPNLRVRYDYESTEIPQPPDYLLNTIPIPATFGVSTFNGATFGATNDPMVRQAVEGSGNTCSFKITSLDKLAPYSINGFYIDYMPSGRR